MDPGLIPLFQAEPLHEAGVSTLVMLALGLLLSAAAYLRRPKSALGADDVQSNFATRGSFCDYVIGRHRSGAHVVYLQHAMVPVPESPGSTGGKGTGATGGGQGRNHTEDVVHVICVGPVDRLHTIYQNGKPIFEGPITPKSHPSGTLIQTAEGTFQPWWGDRDQPADSLISGGTWASRFPFYFRIQWVTKLLGNSKNHPNLEYEYERLPRNTGLVGSSPVIFNTVDDTLPVWPLEGRPNFTIPGQRIAVDIITSSPGFPHQSKWVLVSNAPVNNSGEDLRRFFRPGTIVKLHGDHFDLIGATELQDWMMSPGETDPALPRYYIITESTWSALEVFVDPGNPSNTWPAPTRIFLGDFNPYPIDFPQPTLPATFQISPLAEGENDGVNHAHALDQLMFSPWPDGAALSRSGFDFASLEDVARTLRDEGLRCNIRAQQGEQIESVVADILQDCGMLIPFDPVLGKRVFRLIREAPAERFSLPRKLISTPAPEREVLLAHPERPSKMQFGFPDRRRNYRIMTFTIDDPGTIVQEQVSRLEDVKIPTVTDFQTAQVAGRRRAQEALSNAAKMTLTALRDGNLLTPGTYFDAPDFDVPLLVAGVQRQQMSGKTRISFAPDFYGVPAFGSAGGESLDGDPGGGLPPEHVPPSPDLLFRVFEAPRYLLPDRLAVIALRIRQHDLVSTAWLHLSRDGDSYQRVGGAIPALAGGVLQAALPAKTDFVTEAVISALGPDITTVEDLSTMPDSWMLGRQVAVIGDEICFLQRVEGLGASSWRMEGLVRGRLGTRRQSHAAGTAVFIVPSHSITLIQDILIVPGKNLHAKTQPFINGQGIGLDEVDAQVLALQGTGLRPMPICSLRTPYLSPHWFAGGSVFLTWSYRSTQKPKTGAGMQGAGLPTGQSDPQGTFLVSFMTDDVVPVLALTVPVDQPSIELESEVITAIFGGEPASMIVRVVEVQAGYKSPSVEITLVRI